MDDPKKGQDNADHKKVAAKGQRKGRAHAITHDQGKNKDTKDVSKHGSEAENIPEEIDPPKNLKDRILRWMDHQVYVVTMVVVTVLALFMVDVVSAQTPRICKHSLFEQTQFPRAVKNSHHCYSTVFVQWEAAGPPPQELDIVVNSVMLVCLFFFTTEVHCKPR